MANKRDAVIRAMETALREIAAMNEYPMPPAHYLAIQRGWRRMVLKARKAVAKIDALTENDL